MPSGHAGATQWVASKRPVLRISRRSQVYRPTIRVTCRFRWPRVASELLFPLRLPGAAQVGGGFSARAAGIPSWFGCVASAAPIGAALNRMVGQQFPGVESAIHRLIVPKRV